jgi:DNA-directed RNA polymerase specialized sigma24 family protein
LKRERRWSEALREEAVLDSLAAPIPERLGSELAERLPELVALASPASRPALLLHYQDGMSLQETADILGVAAGTVKSRIAYGLVAIRKAVGAEGGWTERKGVRS